MTRNLLAVLASLAALAAAPTRAATTCPGFFSDHAADALLKRLSTEPCRAAVATLRLCRWGSGADIAFGPPVVKTCERGFYARLSPEAKRGYGQRMQMCADRYAGQEGSIYVSEAVVCQAELAARAAADPIRATAPVRASFDCAKARTPLETAICSDAKLGQADVILSDAYADALASVRGPVGRAKLGASERRFLAAVVRTCRLTAQSRPGAASVACARTAFEARFKDLDGSSGSRYFDPVDTRVAPPG